jgi:peroxiredoxin
MDLLADAGLAEVTSVAALPPGTPAPDFALHRTADQTVALRDLRGRAVVLAFYPADWCLLSGAQLASYQQVLPELRRFGAALLAVSVDSVWSHLAFAGRHGIEFPLLSDFQPRGAVARAYGVYRPREGTSARAIFVIDGQGVIRWSEAAPDGVDPGVDGLLTALERLEREGTT